MDKIAPRLSFFFGIGMNFYMEVRHEAGAGADSIRGKLSVPTIDEAIVFAIFEVIVCFLTFVCITCLVSATGGQAAGRPHAVVRAGHQALPAQERQERAA